MHQRSPRNHESVTRGVALRVILDERDDQELQELLSFWDGQAHVGQSTGRLIGDLLRLMSSEKAVRKRVKFLSKKLVDLLKFFLRGNGYRAELSNVTGTQGFSYLSSFELKAAVNALLKRGFLFAANGSSPRTEDERDGPSNETFLVPCELGDVLQAFIWDDDRTVEEIFSLQGQLSRVVDRKELGVLVEGLTGTDHGALKHDEATAFLTTKDAVAKRLAEVPETHHELLRIVGQQYGGTVSKATLMRGHKGLPDWNRKELQELLELNLLGTVRHVSLGEFGIHQFDEAVVLFAEVVDPLRQLLQGEPPEIDELHTLGVNLISDISAFLSFVEHNPIKLTLSGKVYRTAVRKLEDDFIIAGTSGFTGDWLFQYLFDFCMSQAMMTRGEERSVSLTIKGRSWDRTPLDTKLSRLLKFSCANWTSQVEPFHGEALLTQYLDCLRELVPGQWVDINAPAFDARNRYLAELDHLGVRDRFQSRYQFAQQSGMRDPHRLALALTTWSRERLFLFGLIDLGELEGKQVSLRLTPLGAKALGIEVPADSPVQSAPLVVNPDFEVILFPNDETYDLITALDRFAERISSDSAYRYKLTEASIEKAVAEGLESATILRTLSEHSRVEVPQNVIYSIGQWAAKVKFVQRSLVTLVRGRTKEVIDRILHHEILRVLVIERLSPTAIILSSDLQAAEFEEQLLSLGIFLEDSGV
ncbi:MAG: hypothetical protein ACI9EF_002933 [Pseudohongiellaceae bacterium]